MITYLIDELSLWQIIVDANFAKSPSKYFTALKSNNELIDVASTVEKDAVYTIIHENIMQARIKLKKMFNLAEVDDELSDLVDKIFNDYSVCKNSK